MADDILNSLYKESVKKYKQLADDINNEIVKNNFKFTKENEIRLGNDNENTRRKKLDINEMLSYFKLEQDKITSINKQRQEYETNLQKFKIKNQVESFNLEKNMISKQLQNYKNIYKESFNEKSKFIKKNEEAELKIYESALNENRKLTDAEIKEVARLHREKIKYTEQDIEYQIKQEEKAQDKIEKKHKERIESVGTYFSKLLEKILNFGLDTFIFDRFKSGIDNFSSYYEQNFTEIAGRTGSNSRQENHNFITGTLDNIMSDEILKHGLNFNKDVFPEITNAVKNGFQGEEAQSIAITNAIDKKIMPWLETSSNTWSYLQFTLSDNSLNQLKGQQLLLQETREGNRLLQTGVIASINDTLAPILSSIDVNTTSKEDLGQFYAIAQAQLGDNAPESMIKETAKKMYDAVYKPFDALTKGTTEDKIRAIGFMNTGTITGMEDFLYNTLGKQMESLGDNRLAIGAYANGMGINLPAHIQEMIDAHFTSALESSIFENSNKNLEDIYNNKKSNLRENVTRTQDFDNSMENTATNMFDGWAMFPHGMEMANNLVSEVKHISHLLTALVTAKAGELAKLLGGNIAGGSESSMLSSVIGKIGGGASTTAGLSKAGLATSKAFSGLGLNSGAANTIGAGGVLAGTAMAIYGTKEAFGEFKQIGKAGNTSKENWGHIGNGTLAAAGAIGGGVGAGMLLASNPAGWTALAIGGLALGVKKLNDHFAELSDGAGQVSKNFELARESIKNEIESRENQILSLRKSMDELDSTNDKIEFLKNNGLNPQIDKTTDINTQLKTYLDNLIKINDQTSDDAEGLLDSIEANIKNETNKNLDIIKDEFVKNYSAEAIAEREKIDSKDKDKIWEYQKKALQKAGYNDNEINALGKHFINGAAGKGELHDFIYYGQVDGKNIGSFEDHYEQGNISVDKVNYLLRHADSEKSMVDYNEISQIIGQYADKLVTLHRWKVENKKSEDYDEKLYEDYKKLILGLPKDYKTALTYAFEAMGDKDAMSTWPDSLKGYRSGSSYIQYDQIAQLHAKERVLTAEQNREYTENLIGSGSSTGVIEAGVKDLVSAIQDQTKTILDYLSSIGSNTFSYSESSMNMLPRMGNTRVVF